MCLSQLTVQAVTVCGRALLNSTLAWLMNCPPFWFPIKFPMDRAATERGKCHMPQVWILDKFVKHTKIMERNYFCKVQFACWTFSEMGPEMVSSTVSAQQLQIHSSIAIFYSHSSSSLCGPVCHSPWFSITFYDVICMGLQVMLQIIIGHETHSIILAQVDKERNRSCF